MKVSLYAQENHRVPSAGHPYSCEYGGLKTNGDVQLTGLDEFGRQIAECYLCSAQPISNQSGKGINRTLDLSGDRGDMGEELHRAFIQPERLAHLYQRDFLLNRRADFWVP